jgi:amino acid permease
LVGVAWAAGWISFRTSRPAWLVGLVAVAGAAMLGFFPFLADHCSFGEAHEYGITTFVWPLLLIFTSPIALAGALVGALARAAQTRLRNRRTSLDPF